MKLRIRRFAAALTALFALSAAAHAATETYLFDKSHSKVGFQIRHWLTKVEGRFTAYDGKILIDREKPANSSVEMTIQASSIDTGQERRDNHLRSADFFDVERFPTIAFRSREVRPTGAGDFSVVGDLTIRDVTRDVTLEVTDEGRGTDPWGGERAGFSATAEIDRRDFGLTWNQALEAGGVLVGNEIRISLEVELVKQAAAEAA